MYLYLQPDTWIWRKSDVLHAKSQPWNRDATEVLLQTSCFPQKKAIFLRQTFKNPTHRSLYLPGGQEHSSGTWCRHTSRPGLQAQDTADMKQVVLHFIH